MSEHKVQHDHAGHRKRLRDRFCANGLDGFAPHETLELILSYAIPRCNVNPLAHQLLKRFGSLHNTLDASVEELQQVEGIGEYAAVLISLFAAVAAKYEESREMEMPVVRNRGDMERHCIRLLKGCREEHFYVVCLNGQMEVLADALIARGSIGEVKTYPRIVAETALRYNAHSVILCHNHPGGTVIPSAADMETTANLISMLNMLEIRLIDHIIVAGGAAMSMNDEGLIQTQTSGYAIERNRAANSAGEILISRKLAGKK